MYVPCMCVCMYACMFVYMAFYVCMYVCIYLSINTMHILYRYLLPLAKKGCLVQSSGPGRRNAARRRELLGLNHGNIKDFQRLQHVGSYQN